MSLDPVDNLPSAEPTQADNSAPDTQANQTEGQETALENQLPDPDELEEELEGVKLKGKRELLDRFKSERLLHGDYTRKTMSLAEERKAFEQEREQLKQSTKVTQDIRQGEAIRAALDIRLNQLKSLNWQSLYEQNPPQAQALRLELDQLRDNRASLDQRITQMQQHQQLASQQEIAKQARDAQEFLMREFKDWSPQKDAALESHARSIGVNTKALSDYLLRDPAIAIALDDSMKWRQLQKERAAKPKTEQAPKPVTRIGGAGASTSKALSDLSVEEYAKARQERKSRR